MKTVREILLLVIAGVLVSCVTGGWPGKGFLILIGISRLHNVPVTQERGGCPRFGVGTWVLGLPSLPS